MASMARSLGNPGNEWQSTLVASGCEEGFFAKYDEATAAAVIDYLVRDPDNPVEHPLLPRDRAAQRARGAHRADRRHVGARSTRPGSSAHERLAPALRRRAAARRCSTGSRSARCSSAAPTPAPCCATTPIYFTRLGTFLERADNTARILDVKYHVLLPQDEGVGGALDYYQWQAILRSVSALRGYHWVYHDRLKPWLIAELLILRPEMPRSLLSCYDEITQLSRPARRGLWRQARRMPPARRRAACAAALRPDRGHLPGGAARVPDRRHRGDEDASAGEISDLYLY